MKRINSVCIALICLPLFIKGQTNISGVINVYAKVTRVDTTCQSTLTVSTAAGYQPGDTVLLIQMKGATVDISNTASFGNILDYGHAGNYELGTIASVNGNDIVLSNKLIRKYDPAGSAQLVRVPFYGGNVNVTGTLTADPWDGDKGGVLIFYTNGTVTLNADIDVSGKGFRGGSTSVNGYVAGHYTDYFCPMSTMRSAQKGESIAQANVPYEAGRGMLANAGGGGNDHNAGGGGGGNAGAGGRGGDEFDGWGSPNTNGGVGGTILSYSNTSNKIFFGGGGGGGHQNNNVGMDGTAGGGIAIINASALTANNHFIKANGLDNGTNLGNGDDGAGGGGGGGTVLLDVPVYNGVVTVETKGGAGGNVNWAGQSVGPGGGGGGGTLWLSASVQPANVTAVQTGGLPGRLVNPANGNYNSNYGSITGDPGTVLVNLQMPRSTVVVNLPVVDLGPDTTICSGNIQLQSSVSYSSPAYLWNTGSTSLSITVTQNGIYWLLVTDKGCEGSDTIEVTLGVSLSVDLGNDTGICDKDAPITLSSPQPAGTQYLWNNGLNVPSIQVTQSGIYWLEVTSGSCVGSDTIAINIIPTPVVFIGRDTFICSGDKLTIGAIAPGAAYQWNTGATTFSIEVSESGQYWMTADFGGCRVTDTVEITKLPLPEVDLGPDKIICPEQTIVLDAAYPGGRYRWNTGDTTSALSVQEPGNYWVMVSDAHHCSGYDTISVIYHPLPEVSLGRDTTVCEEQPLSLKVYHADSDSLLWSDGTSDETLIVNSGGLYTVSGINRCGMSSDTINVQQIFCDLWVPNAFTPNGDGVNDVFRVLGNVGRTNAFGFSIYNRWGQRIFHTTDRYKGWDGSYGGSGALLGTYIYVLEYELAGKPVLQKGNFHLIR